MRHIRHKTLFMRFSCIFDASYWPACDGCERARIASVYTGCDPCDGSGVSGTKYRAKAVSASSRQ